jgi:drug/metabolite transporter (DMT)-like permease
LLLAFIGVVTLFGDQLALPNAQQLRGDLWVLASAAILGLKITYVKSLLGRIGVLPLVFWEATTAVPLFAVTGWLFEDLSLNEINAVAVGSLFYQGWAVSCVGFLIWTKLLARYSPNDLAAYSFTTPIFGAIFGWLVLDEPLTVFLAAGGMLAAVGIYLVNTRPTRIADAARTASAEQPGNPR